MQKIWIISPYYPGTSETACYGTYSKNNVGKGFEKVWQYDMDNKTIALGSNFMGSPEGMSEYEIRDALANTELSKLDIKRYSKDTWIFWNKIEDEDIIVAKKGLREIVGVGKAFKDKKNKKICFFSEEKGFERTGNSFNTHPNFLNVKWINKERKDFGEDFFYSERFAELEEILIVSKKYKFLPIIEELVNKLMMLK